MSERMTDRDGKRFGDLAPGDKFALVHDESPILPEEAMYTNVVYMKIQTDRIPACENAVCVWHEVPHLRGTLHSISDDQIVEEQI